MKILIVSVDFPPHTDGVSTVSHELATRLALAGEEVIVIGPSDKGDRDYDSRQKFKVYRSPFYEFGYLRFIPLLILVPCVIIRHHIKYVIPMNIAYGGIIAYFLQKILGFSYSMWAYGYEFGKFEKKPFMKKLYLKIYANADFVAAITNYVKDRLVKFGVEPKKVILVKPGTDPEKFFPDKVEAAFFNKYGLAGKKIILSVGRLVERKGADMTIRAMKEVVKKVPDALYVIAGAGPFKERLVEIANEEGVLSCVRFLGRLPQEELSLFYNACDCFIMASRTLDEKGDVEGYGIVYLEANACGKPVIGGRDGGMGEAIEDKVTGLLVNSFDTKEISCAIINLLSDQALARRLGQNGRRRVVDELNWARAIEKFYRKLKDKGQSP
ncbi:MAG: glycosyltransferase family 4 protein [Candidatus Omnitrophica bacterium]|nr:glycosyltransferase family 4 protein [Candidatus Omnitrophota bacterium]MBU1869068.1 glycosyltransferase family 4 protein [Candidatus Omnitrophota bacterium]